MATPKRTLGKCGKPSSAPQWLIVIALALIASLVLLLVYRFSTRRNTIGEPFYSGKQADAKLVFLHMRGCGWCDKFKPTWDEFERSYGSPLAASGVTIASYERSDPAAAAYKSSVNGYPTVLLVTEGGAVVTKFEGERTSAGLVAFLKANGLGYALGKGGKEGYHEPQTGVDKISSMIGSTFSAGYARASKPIV